jgi:nicotinamidase-related amidase
MKRLERGNTVLAIIDVQERLMPVISQQEQIEKNIDRLIRGCHILGVPILITEQYVKGLGHTVPLVRRALEEIAGYTPIEKSCFSGLRCDAFEAALRKLNRKQVMIAGIEAHVCVFQTVADLLEGGGDVAIIADAISSRSLDNKDIAIRRMMSDGAKLTSTEMALFELLVASGTDEFRAISRLVK